MLYIDINVFAFCSLDGKCLVSVGSNGPSRVWDVASAMPIAALQKERVINYVLVYNTGKTIFV